MKLFGKIFLLTALASLPTLTHATGINFTAGHMNSCSTSDAGRPCFKFRSMNGDNNTIWYYVQLSRVNAGNYDKIYALVQAGIAYNNSLFVDYTTGTLGGTSVRLVNVVSLFNN